MWFYKKIWFSVLILVMLFMASSCGFKPLYSDYSEKKEINGKIKVSEVSGKEGYYIKEELIRHFGVPSENAFLLTLTIDTLKMNEVISPSNEITSYRLIMTASYNVKNMSGETVLPTQKSSVRTGFSSASNSTGYATQIAEEAAKKRLAIKVSEKISTRLSVLSEKWL